MSISTTEISLNSTNSGMSGITATPSILRSANVLSGQQDASTFGLEAWRSELKTRINVATDEGNEFVDKFVPCNTTRPIIYHREGLASLFSTWTPESGKEKESYPILVRGCVETLSSV